MSTSPKNNFKFKNILSQKNTENEKNIKNKIKKKISLQNDVFVHKEIFNKLNEGSVLHFIRSENRKDTVKSSLSEPPKDMDYDLCMINKFDENLNNSLSFISEFDLEDDGNEKDNSFDSLDNDKSVEQIEICNKNCRKSTCDKDDEEFNYKLEKEWNDIKDLLLNKNNMMSK
jgi:hypothetical protein